MRRYIDTSRLDAVTETAVTLPARGTKVRCHKNLHRGDWSITVKGKVVGNVNDITLGDVTFHYWQGGYDKIMAAHTAGHPRRRVCAWARGTVVALPKGARTEVTYNPYRANCFTTRDGTPVTHCAAIHFTREARAFAIGAVR